MPEAVMTLQFEGEAVDAGTMDVRQLAPALIAAADAMREAHTLLQVPGPAPQVEVRATRPGSFIIDLLVAEPSLYQRAIEILTSPPVGAVAGLEALVIAVVSSLNVVKRIRNRRIGQIERNTPGVTRLILTDGTIIEVPSTSFRLVTDAGFRRALNGMVAPLASDSGISSVTLTAEDQSETVTRSDLGAFEIPPSREEALGESVSEVVLRPVAVSFAEGNKWRFHDGETTFFAGIEDPRFAAAVELGTESFAKNDMLRVRLRTRQTIGSDGLLHTERAIVEVLEHLSGAIQLDLFAESADGSPEGESST